MLQADVFFEPSKYTPPCIEQNSYLPRTLNWRSNNYENTPPSDLSESNRRTTRYNRQTNKTENESATFVSEKLNYRCHATKNNNTNKDITENNNEVNGDLTKKKKDKEESDESERNNVETIKHIQNYEDSTKSEKKSEYSVESEKHSEQTINIKNNNGDSTENEKNNEDPMGSLKNNEDSIENIRINKYENENDDSAEKKNNIHDST